MSKVVEDACEMFTERDMMKKSELQRFCSMDGFRQTIQEPWLVGGKTLATDGRILIIVNEEVAGVSQNTDAPSARVFELAVAPPAGSTFMGIPGVNEDECHDCQGCGETICFCPHCDDQHECKCKACHGLGSVYTPDTVEIGKRTIQGYYIYMMRDLENVQMHIEGDQYSACYFTFTGGCGVVMPIKKE